MKNSHFHLLFIFFLAFSLSTTMDAQEKSLDEVAPVFIMGQYEEHYDDLFKKYPQNLLTVCNNDMDKAYKVWMEMLKSMEDYAEKVDFDLVGTKIHLNVYWNSSGEIDYISFYPKSASKSVPVNELRAFLLSFQRNYSSDITSEKGFKHNASAIFPTSLQEKTKGIQNADSDNKKGSY